MEDLENYLSAIGYRPIRETAACWQVSLAGATPRIRPAPQRREPACSPVLRFWLRRLGPFDTSSVYRISRAI
jgi:hypothetical protein